MSTESTPILTPHYSVHNKWHSHMPKIAHIKSQFPPDWFCGSLGITNNYRRIIIKKKIVYWRNEKESARVALIDYDIPEPYGVKIIINH